MVSPEIPLRHECPFSTGWSTGIFNFTNKRYSATNYPPLHRMLYLHTEEWLAPKIHDFPLDDQLTVDFFIYQMSALSFFTMDLTITFETDIVHFLLFSFKLAFYPN